MKFKAILIVALLLIASVGWGTDYYIDPSATYNGNGLAGTQAAGAGEIGAYNTWGSVSFAQGNDYYQKSGTSETLANYKVVGASGTSSNDIIMGAYYLSGTDEITGVNEAKPIVKVNDGTARVFYINGCSYINIKNLNIQGGDASLRLKYCTHITIENCKIGWHSKSGILANGETTGYTECNYLIIKNNTFDSGYSDSPPYEPEADLYDAITLKEGCNYCEVYENSFIDWGHDAVNLQCTVDGFAHGTTHNKIYNNIITSPYCPYSRGFEVQGTDTGTAKVEENEIYNNQFIGLSVRSQINGNNLFQDYYITKRCFFHPSNFQIFQ